MPIESKEHNGHEAIRFIVHLSFVSPDDQNGYQKIEVSHELTKEEAIVGALMNHMNEKYPLKGISVYKLELTL